MGQQVPHGVGDLLLHQLGLGLGHRQVVPLALVGGEHRQQDNGEHGQNDGQQGGPSLREGLVRHGGAGQTDDLRVDGVVAQQGRGGHGAQTCDERHHRQGEHGGHQCGEDHLPQHLEGLGTHVPGGLHGVVVDAPDGVAQEQRVVGGTGERHGKQHRVEAGEPVPVEIREGVGQRGGQDAVGIVQEQVAGDQRHAGVDHGGHVAQAQDIGALDVEILRQQDDGHAHHIDGDDKADGQLQGVPNIAAHVAGEEELDDRPRVCLAGGVFRGEDAGQRVQTRQQHEPEEEVGEQHDADDPHHEGDIGALARQGVTHGLPPRRPRRP